MTEVWYTAAAVAVMALVTAGLRFAPFLLLGGRRTPLLAVYLGRVFPCATVGLLVVYGLKGISFTAAANFVPQLLAGALVVASYVWKRNSLLSIVGGTAFYMVLVQAVF